MLTSRVSRGSGTGLLLARRYNPSRRVMRDTPRVSASSRARTSSLMTPSVRPEEQRGGEGGEGGGGGRGNARIDGADAIERVDRDPRGGMKLAHHRTLDGRVGSRDARA